MTMMPLVVLLGANGCRHCCKRAPSPYSQGGLSIGQPIPIPPQQGQIGSPFAGSPDGNGSGQLPPQGLPPTNYYYAPPPPVNSQKRPEVLVPAPIQSGYPSAPSKRQSNAGTYIGGLNFGEPQPRTPLNAIPGPKIEERVALSSPLGQEQPQSPSPALPVGIPDFSPVKEGISAGLRPEPDGVTWLQNNKYSAVLFLRRGSEDDTADRKLIEARGMKFFSMIVSAEGITPQLVEQFNKIVSESGNRPLFVYDMTGTIAGSMWYLHFRTAELQTDDEARLRAGRLGLSEQGNDEQIKLWLSIQKFLSEKK